jgi:D-alanyl-D-alanine dipeptidase
MLYHPLWLQSGPALVAGRDGAALRVVLADGWPVAFAHGDEGPRVNAEDWGDADGDSIPDALDILIGAKKEVLNASTYRSAYRAIGYPMGDVPREEGVCSDVLVRALRNAGFDLQQLLADDIAKTPARYPMVKKPDTNIDHRRVRTLLPYFLHHWKGEPVDPRTSLFLPGDVCFMNTMHGPEPEHVGIVSDRLGPSGLPLIINNWTDGTVSSEMDLLHFVPVTRRFRPPGALRVEPAARGLQGLLARKGLSIDASHKQLILVTVPTWASSAGVARRFARTSSPELVEAGRPVQVRIGSRGMGRGLGLHDSPALLGLSPKQEGDRKSPAGVFSLGTAFGPSATAPYRGNSWPWRAVVPGDLFVDDPASRHYNTWVQHGSAAAAEWSSAEDLRMYELGLVVEHNMAKVEPGAGSAIFLHTWTEKKAPTLGCTALARADLEALLAWLDPDARPVLVQVAGNLL